MRKDNKGSLTVEATVAFTFFIVVFVFLLNVAKIAVIEYELQIAASDTASQLATSSYLLGKLNSWQDSEDTEIASGTGDLDNIESLSGTATGLFNALFGEVFADRSNDLGNAKADVALGKASVKGVIGIFSTVAERGIDYMYQRMYDKIRTGKQQFFYDQAKKCMADNLKNSMLKLDYTKLHLDVAKMPQTDREYNASSLNVGYIMAGIQRDRDFEKDDVVISLSYEYGLDLPFIGEKKIVLRKTAIEKAWLNGGDGVFFMPRSDKGLLSIGISQIFEAFDNDKVYVTAGSNKYHKTQNCRKIEGLNCGELSRMSAESISYSACSICN